MERDQDMKQQTTCTKTNTDFQSSTSALDLAPNIDPSQLEKRHGGTAPNVTRYWAWRTGGCGMDLGWILGGSGMDLGWILGGSGMDLGMDLGWIWDGSWVVRIQVKLLL